MKVQFTLEDYQKAAVTFAKELTLMPVFSAQDSLKYMTGLPGIRFKRAVGDTESSAQFAPYKKDRKSNTDLVIKHRMLETFFGNVVEDFDPNSVITTLMGRDAIFLGEGQKNAPITKLVLAAVMASLGAKLQDELFTAEENPNGDTTHDLFNGWNTIAEAEITAGNISTEKGNLFELGEAVTSANAVDAAKEILHAMDDLNRAKNNFLYCDQAFADAYNDNYLLTHAGLSYNKEYNQVYVEGSNNRLTIVPLPCLANVPHYFVTDKGNMLYGYDNMSDMSRIQVDRFAPFVLTLSAAMFFGTEFKSIDKRSLLVVKKHVESAPAQAPAQDQD